MSITFKCKDTKIAKEFRSLEEDNQNTVIFLGLKLFNYGKECWSNKHIEELSDIHNDYVAQIKTKNNELLEIKKSYDDEIISLTNKHKIDQTNAVSNAIANAHLSYKNEIEELQKRNEMLSLKLGEAQMTVTNALDKQQEKFDIQRQELRTFYENKLSDLNEQKDLLRNRFEDKISQMTSRTQNSSFKGQDGEFIIEKQLNLLFPMAEVEDTHTIAGRGDFIVYINGITLMVENKNYTRNVQKCEIDKFYRDIQSSANGDINGGMLLSMESGICAREDFSIEFRNGKPVIFLHNVKNNMHHIKLAAQVLTLIINQKDLDWSKQETLTLISETARTLKRNYQKQRAKLDKFYKEQIVSIEEQDSTLKLLFDNLGTKY